MPVIFDLVTSKTATATATSSLMTAFDNNRQMSAIGQQLNHDTARFFSNIVTNLVHLDEDEKGDNDLEGDTDAPFQNHAFLLYIRLCLHVVVTDQPTKGLKRLPFGPKLPPSEKQESKDPALSKFYSFCDKDKSSMLDEREWTIGLLTLFKYIDKDLTVDNLLPIVYDHTQDSVHEYCNKNDFQTLIIDTLTEHLRIQTFQAPTFSKLKCSPSLFDENIEDLCKKTYKTLTESLKVSDGSKNKSPFSVGATIRYTLLFLLGVIGLPIVVFVRLIYYLNEEDNRSKYVAKIVWIFITILLAFLCALLTTVVYLIIINIILYHVYYDDNSDWHVNSLEAYWPFALMIYMVAVAYLYTVHRFLSTKTEKKRREFERYRDESEIQMLKHEVKVTTIDGDRMTVAQFESKDGSSDKKQTINKTKRRRFGINCPRFSMKFINQKLKRKKSQ
ncbi:unnamed protein product [Didymodactylos carnosus]|uniref:Uncharacterized protein n=1 Tax=Didymodactylos carnosus TaxID=1234261 RepID=A0A8S2N5H4_9BILA|nr:unnamed protein product [Didymodactylos carnosus]CAF3990802.1 unnamed protein product [Didymodactylos carnosus]